MQKDRTRARGSDVHNISETRLLSAHLLEGPKVWVHYKNPYFPGKPATRWLLTVAHFKLCAQYVLFYAIHQWKDTTRATTDQMFGWVLLDWMLFGIPTTSVWLLSRETVTYQNILPAAKLWTEIDTDEGWRRNNPYCALCSAHTSYSAWEIQLD